MSFRGIASITNQNTGSSSARVVVEPQNGPFTLPRRPAQVKTAKPQESAPSTAFSPPTGSGPALFAPRPPNGPSTTSSTTQVVGRIMSASTRTASAGRGGLGLDLALLLANLDSNKQQTNAPHPPMETEESQSSRRPAPVKKPSVPTIPLSARVASAGRFKIPTQQLTAPKPQIDEVPEPAMQEPSLPLATMETPPDGHNGKISPARALELYDKYLSRYERREILEYDEVYFLGISAQKIDAPTPDGQNFGYDDERGDYIVVKGDHIAFRYEVLSELGKGSFGQVLKVHDYKKDSVCALKIIRNKKRFHQQATVEIRILDHLRSRDPDDRSCTVRMLNYFKFRSHTIVTFEMHSINLYELTKLNKYQPFAPALIKRFAAQILVAMSFMWREQIVHCDLKPENILLRYENKTSIKIIDFGSSCFETERIYTYIQSRFYRAPEIILGLSYGRPIDLWSFGCIICEMQMGYPVFPGESEKEQLLCIMEVLGVPPPRVIERSPRKKEFFEASGAPKLFPNSRNKVRKPSTKDLMKTLRTEDSSFVDFITSFLRWEPNERMTPNEAMRHPWIAECFHQETSSERQGSAATARPRLNSAKPAPQYPSNTVVPNQQGLPSIEGVVTQPKATVAAWRLPSRKVGSAQTRLV